MELSPSTWRTLGLSVAAVYTGLGSAGMLSPLWFAQGFLGSKTLARHPTSGGQLSSETADVAETLIMALTSRDLSIGLTLFALYYQGQHRAFGTLVLGGLILCAEDTLIQFQRGNTEMGTFFACGASLWGAIGWAMAIGKAD